MSKQLQNFGSTFVIALIFWMLMAGSLQPQEFYAGLLVATAVALLSVGRSPVFEGFALRLGAPLAFVLYLGSLMRALILANMDMARRVLSPSLPIRPDMVQITTELRSDLGRLILANSITLTPGTLSVDVEDDKLTVHWIDCPPGKDMAQTTRKIAGDFERHLKGFLK
jgi:multicomponent Na+:H+ antiporter subunit E